MKTGLIYTLGLCVLGLVNNVTSAVEIFVDRNVSSGTNDGTSWSTAYSNLADAVTDANSNGSSDNIRISSGTYRPNFSLTITEPCVLTGEAGTTIKPGLRAHILFEVESTHVHFKNIVFDRGKSFVNGNESELRFHNCEFQNSSKLAVYARHCPVVELHDCLFAGNRGGLFAIYSGRVQVFDSQFLGNHSSSQGGGALHVDDCETLMVARSLFDWNVSDSRGGAIFVNRISPSLKRSAIIVDCVLQNNQASTGGGIHCLNCHLRVSNCTIIHNHASRQTGGIASHRYGEVAIENTILWGNRDESSTFLMLQQLNHLPTRLVHCCIEDPLGATSAWGRGVINQNPNLRSDGRLRVDSPCINAGDLFYYPHTLLDNPGRDIAGNDRLIGPEIDMGAFEKSLFEYTQMGSSW
jgi:hypothetical protein